MILLTVTEVAALLRCSPRTIYDRVKAKQIPYRKDGHRLLFVQSEVETHVAQLPGLRLESDDSLVRIAVTPAMQAQSLKAMKPYKTAKVATPFRLVEPRGRGH